MADSNARATGSRRGHTRLIPRHRRDTGLTLIELLTVIFIIGILLVLALPVFLNAASRARTSEAFSVVAPVRRAVDEYWATTGELPNSNSQAAVGPQSDYAGKYVRGVNVLDDGVIQIELADFGHVLLTPGTGEGRHILIWRCSSPDIAPQHLPGECRQ